MLERITAAVLLAVAAAPYTQRQTSGSRPSRPSTTPSRRNTRRYRDA
ncbi:hypothetical protein [Pyrobaculum ferrireducens]|uniref:Uncharacterized protein n=1 Tax=Pyrobaculum ferrireducens TaxID=1104324 RepID=G7VE69_9CREN|nr:hypothetical protein [Pyrobaculum ferrireducens]AET32842.1 hypothetical protein P186_1415 [Pyrobaculum ferrireducens]